MPTSQLDLIQKIQSNDGQVGDLKESFLIPMFDTGQILKMKFQIH